MQKILLGAVVMISSLALAPAQQLPMDCVDMARALQDLVRADTRARDFAELRRFRDENRTVKAGDSRVVFLGDSITDLWRQPQFGGVFSGRPFVDGGSSGQSTPGRRLRLRRR